MLNEETETIGMYAADMIGYRVPGRGLRMRSLAKVLVRRATISVKW